MGSRSTHLPSQKGGIAGRPLRRGDELRVGDLQSESAGSHLGFGLRWRRRPIGGTKVRVILGPQADWFPRDAIETFCSKRYRVGIASDRMGYRLEGPPVLRGDAREMLSQAIPMGSVQIPQSGEPMLAMADCQTTGGYPKIATVISADLHLLGQLGPGDWLEFDVCDRVIARQALAELEEIMASVQ